VRSSTRTPTDSPCLVEHQNGDPMALAVVVYDEAEAMECIAHAMSHTPLVRGEVTVIGIPRVPWLSKVGMLSGHVVPAELTGEAERIASNAARQAVQMLPASAAGVHVVCDGWWDPALRAHLMRVRCDRLIVARHRLRTNGLLVHLTLRGTGIQVCAAGAEPR